MAILAPWLAGARVLDLFAGTGSLGRAALDHGASEVVFVEEDPRSLEVLIRALGPGGRVVRGRLPQALARVRGRFRVVLADPPYGSQDGPACLASLARLLEPGGVASFEHHHKQRYPEREGPLRRFRSERHGETALSFYLWEDEHGEDELGESDR